MTVINNMRVKPLVWVESWKNYFEAKTVFGVYRCGIDDNMDAYGSSLPNPYKWDDYPSLSDAKAAAQADYEARIMAELEPAGGE